MGLEMYAEGLRRLREADRRPTVREAIDNFRANTAAMRNDTKEGSNMNDNQEIKIGLTCTDDEQEKVEWKNGDKCIFDGKECIFVASNPIGKAAIIVGASGLPAMSVTFDKLSKPETPEQREERERLEAAYDLYCACGIQHETAPFEEWLDVYCDVWLRIVDKTGYRLEVKPTKEEE